MIKLVLPFAAAFAGTLILTPLVRRFARAIGVIAKPSSDRWHAKPTALLGGVAVYLGFLVGAGTALWALWDESSGSAELLGRGGIGIILASTLMFFVGLVDDKYRLRPTTKLIFQSLAAATVISFGVLYPVTPWVTANVLITFFWFLALTNALNLLDNMDGVAVGVAGVAALFLAATFAQESAWMLSAVCLALAGAAFGFLPYNFHRASIFMGDSGSLFIGALLAGLGAAYPNTAPASIASVLFVPALIVVIPILDTLLVTTTRTLAGRPVSVGGRDHTSHRLVAMGLSESQVALLLYAFAACGGFLAVLLRGTPPGVGALVGAIFLAALLIFAAYLGRMHTYSPSERPSGKVTLLISDLLHKRRAFEVVLDIILFAVAYQGAYLLRWDGTPPEEQSLLFETTIAIAVVCKSIAFGVVGVYRGVWRQIGMADVHRLGRGTMLGGLITFAALWFLFPTAPFARSILILDGLLAMILVTAARASFRSLDLIRHSLDQDGARVLLYGAGRSGELVLRELMSNADLALRPVGFIDDDPAKRGWLIHGYPVAGPVADVASIIARQSVQKILVCTNKVPFENLERLRASCHDLGVELLQLHIEMQPFTYSRPSSLGLRPSPIAQPAGEFRVPFPPSASA